MNSLIVTLYIGIGATLVTGLWSIIRQTLFGIVPPNFGPIDCFYTGGTLGR